MAELETYEHPNEMAIVPWNAAQPYGCMSPGDWIRHADWTGSKGIVIAITDSELVVLWSVAPGPGVVFKPEDFQPKKGIMTRYSTSAIRKDYYGTIKIEDIK